MFQDEVFEDEEGGDEGADEIEAEGAPPPLTEHHPQVLFYILCLTSFQYPLVTFSNGLPQVTANIGTFEGCLKAS